MFFHLVMLVHSTHSFRIGGATEMFKRDISIDLIKKLGRWKGDCYQVYIRPDADTCATWARSILEREIVPELDDITFIFGTEFSGH